MELLRGVDGKPIRQEEEMGKKMNDEEIIKLMATEIAMRAVYDLKLLQRRGVLNGDKLMPGPYPKMTDCQCYQEPENIQKLVDDFRNGSVLFWCHLSGARVKQSSLDKLLEEKHDRVSEVCG